MSKTIIRVKMNLYIYLIETTGDDKWEIIQGHYIVVAENPAKAKRMIKETLEEGKEEITSIRRIDHKKPNVYTVNEAIAE